MQMLKITNIKDGVTREYKPGTTYAEISKDFKFMYPVVAVKINNEIYSLSDAIKSDEEIEFIDFFDPSGAKIYKSGVLFILEAALKNKFPNFEVKYLHSHPKGVYAEFVGDRHLTDEEFKTIKNEMSRIISQDIPIKRYNISKKDASKYLIKNNYIEKALNVQNTTASILTLYTLDNYVNYFYNEMPNSTGAITLYDIKYLSRNKMVILLPNKLTNGRVPEYIEYRNIDKVFKNTKLWLQALDKEYLSDLNSDVSSGKIKDFINVSEIKFNDDIRNIVKNVTEDKDIKFVMIAGPSSSGKTTTTKRLKTYFDCCGYNTITISTDDYFVDREKTPRDEFGKYDFECLHAINIERFNSDIKKLLDGKEIVLPFFDFITGKSNEGSKKIKMDDKTIILIEGLHSLNDDLMPSIDNKYKYKVYISPFIGINIDRHNYISTTDLRLIRRMVRDYMTRGRSVEDTIAYWQTVRSGEVKYIFPYIHQADVILNTALNFEIGVLEVYALPLLLSVKVDSKYYEEARRLLNFLKSFYPIPGSYVSKDSILREFIGKE